MVQAKTQDDPLKVFKQAVDNVKPSLEVKSRARGRLELPGPGRGEPRAPHVAWPCAG